MRTASKVDDNQAEIVQALEAIGCTIESLAAVGKGCPDLLVGYRRENFLLEVKDGKKVPSKRKLRPNQQDWHDAWRGQVTKVETPEEAIAVVTYYS